MRLSRRRKGLLGEVAASFNDLAEHNDRMTKERVRIARVIGREGRMTERAALDGTGGRQTSVDSINSLIGDLVRPTYMLLDDRAGGGPSLGDGEALAELTRRYFLSHGPATQKDQLVVGPDTEGCATGLELVRGGSRARKTTTGRPGTPHPAGRGRRLEGRTPRTLYDELGVAYQDLRMVLKALPPQVGVLITRVRLG